MKKLFVDVGSLAEARTSGIGNTTLNIVRYLAKNPDITSRFQMYLLVPFNKTHFLDRYKFDVSIKIKRVFIPGKVMNVLTRLKLFPYADLMFGKGIYVFPNYRNWPLLYSKSITYIHDMAFKRCPDFVEKRNRVYLESNVETWAKRTDKIFAVSQHAKAEFDHFFPAYHKKSAYIYNGYDEHLFFPKDDIDQNVLRKYGVTQNDYFFHLSSIEPRKNVTMLLNAFRRYREVTGDEETKLLLVGGMSWDSGEIPSIISEINQSAGKDVVIKPSSFVSDEEIPELMNGCTALVHVAWYEGFGLSPLQAMACGKQLVVPHNSSIPEIVGDCGIYIDESNVESVAAGLKKAKAKSMERNVKGIVRARQFTWQKSLEPLFDTVLKLYAEI